jgi:ketosteroid isomerase-like protein
VPMSASDEMRTLLQSLYDSFRDGDASAFVDNLAEDSVGIGTDEAEFWVGRAALAPILATQVAEMSGAGIRLTPGDPVIGESGDAVWAADQPTLHLPDGSNAALRATLLATRDGGRLVLRQMHISVPAPNVEVVQMELTTE